MQDIFKFCFLAGGGGEGTLTGIPNSTDLCTNGLLVANGGCSTIGVQWYVFCMTCFSWLRSFVGGECGVGSRFEWEWSIFPHCS